MNAHTPAPDWIKTAKVGDRVVRVETWTLFGGYGDEVGPVSGQIYTIREIGRFHPFHGDEICVRLVEIVNPNRSYGMDYGEACFRVTRFRPLNRRSTDISIFTDMLKTTSKPLEVA